MKITVNSEVIPAEAIQREIQTYCQQNPGTDEKAAAKEVSQKMIEWALIRQNAAKKAMPVSPAYLQRLVEEIGNAIAEASRSGKDTVLLARSNVRRFLSELVRSSLPKVAVLSYNEVVPARSVETSAIVSVED